MESFAVPQHRPAFTDTHVALFCLGHNGRPIKHRVTILSIYRDETAPGQPVVGYLIPDIASLRDLGAIGVSPASTTHIHCNKPDAEIPVIARAATVCHPDSVLVSTGERGYFVMPPTHEYVKGRGFVEKPIPEPKPDDESEKSKPASSRAAVRA